WAETEQVDAKWRYAMLVYGHFASTGFFSADIELEVSFHCGRETGRQGACRSGFVSGARSSFSEVKVFYGYRSAGMADHHRNHRYRRHIVRRLASHAWRQGHAQVQAGSPSGRVAAGRR